MFESNTMLTEKILYQLSSSIVPKRKTFFTSFMIYFNYFGAIYFFINSKYNYTIIALGFVILFGIFQIFKKNSFISDIVSQTSEIANEGALALKITIGENEISIINLNNETKKVHHYNDIAGLKETLEYIILHTYNNEVIIINTSDWSLDYTVDCVNYLESKIFYDSF